MLAMLDTLDEVSPNKSPSPPAIKEHRREARYKTQWRVAIAIEGNNLIYGRIRDISSCGAALLSEININPSASVKLKIYLPTLLAPCEPRVMVVHGRASYCVHDAEHLCFRSGISFVKFESAADLAYLVDRLASCHVRVPDYVRQRSSDAPISRFSVG